MNENEWEHLRSAHRDEKDSDQQAGMIPPNDAASFFHITDNVVFQPTPVDPKPEEFPLSPAVNQFISQTNSDAAPTLPDERNDEPMPATPSEHSTTPNHVSHYPYEPRIEHHRSRSWFHFFSTGWKRVWGGVTSLGRGHRGIGTSFGKEGHSGG